MKAKKTTQRDELAPVTILGGGNVGRALAHGWIGTKRFTPGQITVTRRHPEKLSQLAEAGVKVTDDNRAAIAKARHIIVAVQPQQLRDLLVAVALDVV